MNRNSRPRDLRYGNRRGKRTPPEGRCPRLDMYAQAVRSRVNARFISRIHKTAPNVTQAQRNAIRSRDQPQHRQQTSRQRRGHCHTEQNGLLQRSIPTTEHYRQLPADPTKEHIRQLNRLIKTLDPGLQSTLRALIPRTPRIGDPYCLPKIHKANTPGRPIVSGNGTLCENLSGYIEGILKPIVQGTPSFCRDTTDFLQKLNSHGPVELGTFLVTMDVSALYTSIPHDDGIAATASVLNTDNCQSPDAILQLICFILDHNVFTFDKFFIQTHGTAMGTKFAPQYANIFMHKFEQDLLTAQDLQPTLYTRYIDDIFFLWTHGEESLKRLLSAQDLQPTLYTLKKLAQKRKRWENTDTEQTSRHPSPQMPTAHRMPQGGHGIRRYPDSLARNARRMPQGDHGIRSDPDPLACDTRRMPHGDHWIRRDPDPLARDARRMPHSDHGRRRDLEQ
ncbi:uncharacterized protein [Scyliorhinus torazame]|uniref:uncharacterized protein n=1 Tax=Scyliorhinus torazame TaxID=75743 RepID=UPI003B592897